MSVEMEGRGLAGRVETGGTADILGIDPGDLGSPFGGLVLHLITQRIKAVAPVLDEIVIVEVLLDDHVDHGHRNGSVGAGTGLDVVLGTRAHPSNARVDVDEL